MATIRLIPSTYAVSSASYLSVSNAANMYHNTDNTTYATITNTYASTSSRYLYLRGFNFDDIPVGVIINSFTVKIKGYESGLSTSTSYAPRLANGTSALSNTTASSTFDTSTDTITIPTGALTWEQIENYGSNFTIMVYVRRANKNTTGYFYCYGAEILVDYTIPVYYNVTLTNNTSATVSVSDAHPLEGTNVAVVTDTLSNITVTDNGTDITSQFVQGQSGSVSKVAESQTHSGIQSGSSYADYAIGRTAEDPYTSTSNMYASSSSTGHVDYSFDFSAIPSGATIQSISVKVYGHRESSTIDSTHVANIQLMSGTTVKGDDQDFTSTSNSMITISNPGTWTREELQSAILRFTVGYYGGLVCGITWSVSYELDGYSYTITNITTDHAIVFSSGGGITYSIRIKDNGTWKTPMKILVKQGGTWVQATKVLVKSGGTWH